MAQARITDFCGRFSDVVSSSTQKLRRAFHPKVAQILWNGQTHFARKNSAEIKRTAAHFLSDHFQRRRISEIARQKFLRPFHPFARDALLSHTKKFRIFGREKKMGHELQSLALIPENLRR